MLSIVLPSKRLAALPEEAIGEASVTVISQMANPENGTQPKTQMLAAMRRASSQVSSLAGEIAGPGS